MFFALSLAERPICPTPRLATPVDFPGLRAGARSPSSGGLPAGGYPRWGLLRLRARREHLSGVRGALFPEPPPGWRPGRIRPATDRPPPVSRDSEHAGDRRTSARAALVSRRPDAFR